MACEIDSSGRECIEVDCTFGYVWYHVISIDGKMVHDELHWMTSLKTLMVAKQFILEGENQCQTQIPSFGLQVVPFRWYLIPACPKTSLNSPLKVLEDE